MADDVDLRFLGEQINRLQTDVRQLKSDMTQLRGEVDADVLVLKTALGGLERNIETFRESVDDRFDQQIELIKSSFRSLSEDIQSLKKK